MATSSITKNFIISSKEQVEDFADAIEQSYQEAVGKAEKHEAKITHLRGLEDVKQFMAKRK